MYHLKKPDIAHLRVIGSKSWVLIPKVSRGGKFRPRSVICRLLGYEGSNQYILWEPGRDIIIYARDVIIDEWNKTYEAIQKEMRENPDDDSLKLICDDEISLEEPSEVQIQESDQVNINDIVDNLVGDVEGERDDQIHDSDYEEIVQ